MANYPYKMQLVVDPDNPRNIVAAGSVSIYDSDDTNLTTLLTLTDPNGVPIPNPISSNANGFTPPFVTTSPEVLWVSGEFRDYFQSYQGMRDEAIAAKTAAENAAATAGAEAAAVATAAIGTATDEAAAAASSAATAASNASASAAAAANAAALVGAPADTAIAAAINGTGATKTALNATYEPLPELPSAVSFSASQPIASAATVTLGASSPVAYVAGVPTLDPNGMKTSLGIGQLGMEFNVWGTAVAIKVYCQAASSTVRAHVEGKLVTARGGDPVPSAAVGYISWLHLTFPTDGPHRVKVSGKEVFWQAVAHQASGGIAPSTENASPVRMLVAGDSWVGGALETPAMNVWASSLSTLLGIPEPLLAGQGGTGYVNTGPGADGWTQDFGDTRRTDQIIAAKPTDVVIFGTINDGTYTEAAIKTAAKAMFATLTTALPTARLHVVVPQPTTNTQQTSAAQVANRRAVTEAAQESANVFTIVNGVDDGWLTDANRPRFLGTDNAHLTQAGHDYVAGLIAAKLRPALLPGATALATFTTYASDSFTRADGALGTTESGAKTWTVSVGTATVTSNQLSFNTLTGTGAAGVYALIDSGQANVAVQAKVTSAGNGCGPALRCSADQTSGGAATGYVFYSEGGVWVLKKRTAYGSFTTLATTAKAVAAGQVARLEANGDVITAKVDGVQVAQVTDAAYNTATVHGVTAIFASKTVDDFKVTSV